MPTPLQLETPRLILRPPTLEDFDGFAGFMADERTAKHLGGAVPRATSWRMFAAIVGAWTLQGFSMFSFIEKSSGRWVGRGGTWMPEAWPGTEVGWGITTAAQRQGYATEAATAVIDWAFSSLGWKNVIHCIEPSNHASIATARSLGSRLLRENVAAPPPLATSWDVYGQTRTEWQARKGSSRPSPQ